MGRRKDSRKKRKRTSGGQWASQLEVLSRFLDSDCTPDGCMNITSAHGFLTAVAIAPTPVPPSHWLPVLYGETDDEEVSYINPKHASRIIDIILEMYNRIIDELDRDELTYRPLLLSYGEDEWELLWNSMTDWCSGFVSGIFLDFHNWQKLTEDSEHSMLLNDILLFGTHEGRKGAAEGDISIELMKYIASKELPWKVSAIRRYWHYSNDIPENPLDQLMDEHPPLSKG